MVAYELDENLQHVRTIRKWRGEFNKTPPFDIGDDTLFVAYSAWAEMTCFDVLGWQHPVHIFDQHTAYLAATNVLLPRDDTQKRPKKDLASACRAYGLEGWERIDKGSIAADIGNGLYQNYGVVCCLRILRGRCAYVDRTASRSAPPTWRHAGR